MPLLQLFLFAYALRFDVKNIPTAVLDQDSTPASRRFVDAFEQLGLLPVVARARLASARSTACSTAGDARAVVVVPHGFGDDVAGGGRAAVAVLVDGSEPNSAQLGAGVRDRALAASSAATARRALGRGARHRRRARSAGSSRTCAIWYNPEAQLRGTS